MAYYDNSSTWGPPGRQASWEQPPPPSRSGASSTVQAAEATAFGAQFEEIDRACDNLIKSGKGFGPPSRRDSMPMGGGRSGGFSEFDPRMGGGSQRHHSVSDYDMRPHSASNLQNFYANQRYAPRPNENDSMMQAKRRMAAQRERELRNYHQEQQFNRNVTSGAKSDRSMSPNTVSEEERRDILARQHRALYGDDSSLYQPGAEGQPPQRQSQDARVAPGSGSGRGHSPLAYAPFGMQSSTGGATPTSAGAQESAVQMPPRDRGDGNEQRANSTSPSSNQQASFSLFDSGAGQHSSRTSNSSPGGAGSPPNVGGGKGAVAPIGTRPAGASGSAPGNPNLSKRSTTPLPSPLSYGLNASEQSTGSGAQAQGQTSSNPPSAVTDKGNSGLGWGSGSGVWGTGKGPLGVQASVWG